MLRCGRRFAAFLFVFSLTITLSNSSDAGEQLLFDKVFAISNWHLHVSQHSFDADNPGEGQLIVSKNTPQKQIQRGFFVLNGAFTFLRNFLVGDEIVFEKDVTLKAANTLFVFLLGDPGASISLQINHTEGTTPAPKINAFTADPSKIKRGASSTLSWQTENADSCEIQPVVGAIEPNGSISVSPIESTSYTLTASGTGQPATAKVTVSIENSAPVADSQAVLTDEDTAITITLTGTDVDGDSLTYTLTIQPGRGTLSGTPPALTYTPNLNFTGEDSFTYTISDGNEGTATATVRITVVSINDAPVALAGPDMEVFVAGTVTLDGSGSQDVDEDPLNFSWTFATIPEGSTATLSDSSAVNPTFTPDVAGIYEVRLIVNDGEFDSPPDQAMITANLRMVDVPEVVEILQEDAEASIITAGLNVGAVSTADSDTVPMDHVISQDPAPGISVPEGSSVDLVVSLGPESSPDDVDYGFEENDQQGGGGLVGETIRILNENALVYRSDFSFPSPHSMGLTFQAVYNSQSGKAGDSGFGWTHTYEAVIDPNYTIDGRTFVRVVDQTGKAHYFTEDTPGIYKGEFKERTQVKTESGDYVWYRLDGSRYGFSSAGNLLWIDDEKGNRLALGYDAQSFLETVTDSVSGRTLSFHYINGLLDYISGPVTSAVSDGIWVTYGYDGNQNLTSVAYADGSGLNYTYNDPNDGHNLTERRNKADHLLHAWNYDTQDRCTENFSVNGTGAAISYVSPTQVNVTEPLYIMPRGRY